VTVEPGITKRGVEYEGKTTWTDAHTGDLSIARLLKGRNARIIRQRSSDLIDNFFQHAIDSLLIGVSGGVAERIVLVLGRSADLHSDDYERAHDEANVIFQSVGAVKHLIIAAEIEAEAILSEHRHLVLALAAELRLRRTMTGAQVDDVISRRARRHATITGRRSLCAYAGSTARA
jgi:hypothetical protein